MRLPPQLLRNTTIVVALLAAGFVLAWVRFLPFIQGGASYTDGRSARPLDDHGRLRFAVWEQAEPLSRVVNSHGPEGRAARSPDGRLLVFEVGAPGLNADLWVAELRDGEPVDARPLQGLCTAADELAPAFGDGELWFASNRAGGEGGLDLFRARYADGTFGAAERLQPGVDTSADECDPAPLPDGGLAFASNRARGGRADWDLYVAHPLDGRGKAGAPGAPDAPVAPGAPDAPDAPDAWSVAPLEALNTPFDEREPCGSAGGGALLFASDRSGGSGGFDLWRSVLDRNVWQPPEALAGVNTGDDERAPLASADGFTLLFAGAAPGEPADLFQARSRELFRLPGRPVGWLDLTLLALLLVLALLTWLGRRWEALDILAKCLLVSLLVHVGLMFWFREVPVETDTREFEEGAPAIKVRLAGDERSVARTRERAGALELQRTAEADAASAPERETLVPSTHSPEQLAAADRAAAAAARALQAPELPAPAAPGPSAESVERAERTAADVHTELAVAQPLDRAARRSQAAPDVALPLTAVAPPAPAPALAEVARPARDENAAALAAAAAAAAAATSASPTLGAAGPARATLGLPVTPHEQPEHGRRPVTLAPQRAAVPDGGLPVALAGPAALPSSEAGASSPASASSSAAPELELSSLAALPALSPERTQGGGAAAARPPARQGSEFLSAPPAAARPQEDLAAADTGRPSLPEAAKDPWAAGAPVTSLPATTSRRSGAELPPRRSPTAHDTGLRELPDAREAARGALPGTESGVSPGIVAHGSPPALDATGKGAGSGVSGERSVPAAAFALDALLHAGDAGPRPSRAAVPASRPERLAAAGQPLAGSGNSIGAGRASGGERPGFQPLVLAAPGLELPERDAERWEHTPYRSRFGDAKLKAIETYGGSQQTERAVADGLAYLARLQSPDGQWGSEDDYDNKYGHVAVGKSALCLLAFLGAGHTPGSQTEHSAVARRAVDFLLSVQDDATGHFGYSEAYSHGITTYALAECYALTSEIRLRAPLQRAVAWILQNQVTVRDARLFGGWTYYYPDGRTYDLWPRASITAWQVMALESARLGGLEVPDKAFADAATFLRNTHLRERGVLLYNHDPERLQSSYWTLPGSTPAALFALSLLGEDVTDPLYGPVVDYISDRAPREYRDRGTDAFVHQAAGNLYFWYYGSLALLRHGGQPWTDWNTQLQATLLPAQQPDGSWQPIDTYAEYAGDDDGDRSYTTAMCVLTLEVYYRYFTPLLAVQPAEAEEH